MFNTGLPIPRRSKFHDFPCKNLAIKYRMNKSSLHFFTQTVLVTNSPLLEHTSTHSTHGQNTTDFLNLVRLNLGSRNMTYKKNNCIKWKIQISQLKKKSHDFSQTFSFLQFSHCYIYFPDFSRIPDYPGTVSTCYPVNNKMD